MTGLGSDKNPQIAVSPSRTFEDLVDSNSSTMLQCAEHQRNSILTSETLLFHLLSAFKENFYQVVNVRKTRLEQEGSSTDSRSLFILHSKIAENSNLVEELGATKAARTKQQKVTI